MRLPDLRQIAKIVVIGLAWCLWPTQAQAQTYPCPGPGPGERMVGMTQASNGIGSVPLCTRDDAQAPPPPEDQYAAIAWHPDAADIWVDGNYNGPNSAERGALDMCNQVMGGGCSSPGEWWNSSMSVIRDHAGNFYKGWHGEGAGSRAQVLAECSAKQLLPCEVFATFRSSIDRRSPGAAVRKFYAASAWVDRLEGYDHKLYVASGHRSADAATEAAINACNQATSQACRSNALTGNGFIQAYRINGDETATSENTAKRAQQAAMKNCKKHNNATCEIQEIFDSRTSGLFVHEFRAGNAP